MSILFCQCDGGIPPPFFLYGGPWCPLMPLWIPLVFPPLIPPPSPPLVSQSVYPGMRKTHDASDILEKTCASTWMF